MPALSPSLRRPAPHRTPTAATSGGTPAASSTATPPSAAASVPSRSPLRPLRRISSTSTTRRSAAARSSAPRWIPRSIRSSPPTHTRKRLRRRAPTRWRLRATRSLPTRGRRSTPNRTYSRRCLAKSRRRSRRPTSWRRRQTSCRRDCERRRPATREDSRSPSETFGAKWNRREWFADARRRRANSRATCDCLRTRSRWRCPRRRRTTHRSRSPLTPRRWHCACRTVAGSPWSVRWGLFVLFTHRSVSRCSCSSRTHPDCSRATATCLSAALRGSSTTRPRSPPCLSTYRCEETAT